MDLTSSGCWVEGVGESMDEEIARAAKLDANQEWNQMVSELMPHIESSSVGDALWTEVSKTD